jgi:hypothetical protein
MKKQSLPILSGTVSLSLAQMGADRCSIQMMLAIPIWRLQQFTSAFHAAIFKRRHGIGRTDFATM